MQSAFVSAYFKIVEQSENNFDTIFSLAAQPHFDRHDSTVSLSTKSQSFFKSKCLKQTYKNLKIYRKTVDTKYFIHYINTHVDKTFGSLAQSVEQRTVNPCVAGSSPAGAEDLKLLF